MAVGSGLQIGIALGRSEAVAVVQGRKRGPVAHTSVGSSQGQAEWGAALRKAFQDLRTSLEAAAGIQTEGARVHLTLLPPLVDTRLLHLPPMRKEEIQAVLTRDVARYFLGPNRPRVVGVQVWERNRTRSSRSDGRSLPVLAAAAPLELLEDARSAVRGTGWRVASFSSAFGGWLATARGVKGGPVHGIVSAEGGLAHVLRLENGEPVEARQIPPTDISQLSQALGHGPGRILVLASPQDADGIQSALAPQGWSVLRDPAGWPGPMEGAAARAGAGNLLLVPPSLHQERQERRRRVVLYMFGGALLLLLLSAAISLWGARRELESVRSQRQAIRSEVAPLLQARDSLNKLRERVDALMELEASAPIWSRSLVELTHLLPEDTYLTSFYASGDTLELEAAGTGAGQAIQRLREAGLFEDLRLQGVVEREMEGGETVREQFSLRGRLPSWAKGGGE